jgi:hypothetical protein
MRGLKAGAILVGLLGTALWAFQDAPLIQTVEPDTAKAGAVVVAKGQNLDKSKVCELYLTDEKKDTQVNVTEQTTTELKFTVPHMAPGKYHLMVMTANRSQMIEQPVILMVEEGKAD